MDPLLDEKAEAPQGTDLFAVDGGVDGRVVAWHELTNSVEDEFFARWVDAKKNSKRLAPCTEIVKHILCLGKVRA